MNKYYVSGLIGSGIPGFIVLVFLTFSLGIFLWVLARAIDDRYSGL